MKKTIIFLTVAAVLSVTSALCAFTTSGTYNWGKGDQETTMAVVTGNVTVTAGQAVYIAYADTQTYTETGAVVTNDAAAEHGMPLGIALTGGTGGSMIRVLTRGYTSAAYVNGIDSGSAAGIVRGALLAGGYKAGTLGAATTYMTSATGANAAMTAINAAQTRPCAISLGTVAATDTGGAYTYPVYVFCR